VESLHWCAAWPNLDAAGMLVLAQFAFIDDGDGSPFCLDFALAPPSAASCCAGPPALPVLTGPSSAAGCPIQSAAAFPNTSGVIADVTSKLDQIRDAPSGLQSSLASEPICTAFQFMREASRMSALTRDLRPARPGFFSVTYIRREKGLSPHLREALQFQNRTQDVFGQVFELRGSRQAK
jgi:hypothetical protein